MSHALNPGQPIVRKRALFGLLDADGWGWATVKALFWFLVIILTLGYIPDRAYYFTVNKTLDLGILAWSPINFCAPENVSLPCPPPPGSVVPWQSSPAQLNLPAARTGGTAVIVGKSILYVGGSDGQAATASTEIAPKVGTDNMGAWSAGPALPAPRTKVAVGIVSGSVYAIGGNDSSGKPTTTAYQLKVDQTTGALSDWKAVDSLALPEARAGATLVVLGDGLLLIGGNGPDGKPATTVWKTTDSSTGLGPWTVQAPLPDGVTDAAGFQAGDYVWLIGGTDAHGAVGAVQRGTVGTSPTPAPVAGTSAAPTGSAGASAAPAASPGASSAPAASPGASSAPSITPPDLSQKLLRWAVNSSANLPAARTATSGFTANGTIYVVGGSDGTSPRPELYWAIPDASGNIPEWKHLKETDLPAGRSAASPVVDGSVVFLIGGSTADGVRADSVRANLAPQEPFFQLGLVGATVPALMINGEIGQQLGYLNAAGAGTLDFAILIAIGWAFAHKETVRAWVDRRRAARRH